MTDILKPVYGQVWATTGEKLSPDSTKVDRGWVQEMMPYQWENFLQNRQDVAITYILQKGIPEWSSDQEYIENKSVVSYGGQLYMATSTVTNVLPTVAASWKKMTVSFDSNGTIPIALGGTGAVTAADARTNLGIGTIALQAANAVSISGGAINSTSIGATAPSTGKFTNIEATGTLTAASIVGTVTGNASSATKFATPRTVAISGAVTGTATIFDGSANIEIPITALDVGAATVGVLAVNRGGTGVITSTGTGANVQAISPALTGTPTAPTAATDTNSLQIANMSAVQAVNSSDTGSAATALKLKTARTIGGVSFDGTSNINLPGVNIVGTQNTSGSAATLTTPRTFSLSGAATGTATSFNGSANITIPVTALNGTNITTGNIPEARMSSFAVTKTSSTGSAKLPSGTTAQRDASPSMGYTRFNSTLSQVEWYNGTIWESLQGDTTFSTYTSLRSYIGSSNVVDMVAEGLSGRFYHDVSDTTSLDNGGTIIVDNSNRRWKRLYSPGSVHVGWFGAKAISGSEAVNGAAILAAHNYCAGQLRDKRLMFGAGSYPFNSTLTLVGGVEWEGPQAGGAGATLEWTGSASVALALDPGAAAGNYQGIFRKIRIARNAAASRAVAFDLIKCSEYEFQDAYVSDMGTAFRFQGAPINYFDRIVTANCDVVFEYKAGAGLFANAMHVISRCNFWETNECVFKFTSGDAYSIFYHDSWSERFGTFIKDGQTDAGAFSLKDMRVRDCHLLSVDAASTRLIYYKAKAGNIACNISRISFESTVIALNSGDHVCLVDNNGNTSVSTYLFGDISFRNVHVYGAPTALVSSNKIGTSVRVTGDTIAQRGYYSGSNLVLAHGSAKLYEANKPQFYATAWSSDSGTQPSIGNGAIESNYTVESGRANVRIALNFGTSTIAGSGIWRFSLPGSGAGLVVGTSLLQVPGSANYACTVTGNAANGFVSLAFNTNGNLVPFGITTNSTTALVLEFSYTLS